MAAIVAAPAGAIPDISILRPQLHLARGRAGQRAGQDTCRSVSSAARSLLRSLRPDGGARTTRFGQARHSAFGRSEGLPGFRGVFAMPRGAWLIAAGSPNAVKEIRTSS